MQDPNDIDELITLFARANPDGVDPTRVLNKGAYGANDTAIRTSIQRFGQTIGYTGQSGKVPINQAISRVKAQQRAQQGQQGGPAPAPVVPAQAGPSLRAFLNFPADENGRGDRVTDTGSVVTKMGLDTMFQDQQDERTARATVANILPLIKRVEEQRQNVLGVKDKAGIRQVLSDARLYQQIERDLDSILPDGEDQYKFVKKIVKAMQEISIEFARH